MKETSREKALFTLHVMIDMHFLLQKKPTKYHEWSYQNVCDAVSFCWKKFLFDLAPSCKDK